MPEKHHRVDFVCFALISSFLCCPAWSQAHVNENLEKAHLYVDAHMGSDSNPGTQSLPFKTIGAGISAAEANNGKGVGTRVIINPGIYREALKVSGKNNQTNAPMTFEAATNGTVFVSGAVRFSGWIASGGNPAIYSASWPYQWGLCPADGGGAPLEQDIVRRSEMVFVGRAHMTQVLSHAEMMYPGTFYVDETARRIYLRPPVGTDMATADVEVSTVPNVLNVSAGGSFLNGVVFRGMVFERANTCRQRPAVNVSGATNILFDSDAFVWNNALGLALDPLSSGITVSNSTANHNGAMGFHAFRMKNVLWQNLNASYNNWRGAQGAYYDWGSAGLHVFSGHDMTISGLTAIYNQTYGMHWDTDVANVTAANVLASKNLLGFLHEKSEGPTSVAGSTFCDGQLSFPGNDGFTLTDVENVAVSGSTFYNGSNAQVYPGGLAGGFSITNWETGQKYDLTMKGLTFTSNTIVSTEGQWLFKSTLTGHEWTTFLSTLNSDLNDWWTPSTSNEFVISVPKAGTPLTFNQWQDTSSQDLHSTFQKPSTDPAVACTVAAESPDYWLIAGSGEAVTDASGKATFALSTISLGGKTGKVALSAVGLSTIPGVQATFSPASILTSGTSVLTVTTTPNTPTQTYTFTVLANVRNVTRTVVLSLVVSGG
jgi:hypothetical protein